MSKTDNFAKIPGPMINFPILKRKVNGKRLVYLDNAATTRLHPEVKAEMEKVGAYANPSSLHRPGREARRAMELTLT